MMYFQNVVEYVYCFLYSSTVQDVVVHSHIHVLFLIVSGTRAKENNSVI